MRIYKKTTNQPRNPQPSPFRAQPHEHTNCRLPQSKRRYRHLILIHPGNRIFIPVLRGFVPHSFSDIWKDEKYKALILKYMACILKYMACIFYNKPYVFFNTANAFKNVPKIKSCMPVRTGCILFHSEKFLNSF